MKRTMVVMFALALLVGFSGSAMATGPAPGNNALLKAAKDNCKIGSTPMFASESLASDNQLLVMPYATAADPDDFRTGIALINKGQLDQDNILANSLCLVGVKKDGTAVSKLFGSRIVSGAIVTEVVDLIGDNWNNDMIIGVYQNQNAGVNDKLNGFYIIGDGTQAQGAFALTGNVNGTDEVMFDYVPGAPFAGGVAIFNNNANVDAKLVVDVTYSDGTTLELSGADRITVERGRMILNTFENMIDGFDTSKAAQIKFTNNASGDGTDKSLFAFTFFGDGAQAYGYSSPQP